ATLARRISGINQVHTAAGRADPPGYTEIVRRTLAGIRRTRAIPPKRRRPLHLTELAEICTTARSAAHTWASRVATGRDCALLLMGHLGACRGAELAALHLNDIILEKSGATVTVRSSKTDQEATSLVKALRRTT